MTLAGDQPPERVSGAVASSTFFRVVGATPRLGRWISDDDDRHGAAPVAIIAEGLWRRRFGETTAVLGRGIQIDGALYTIVGVAPASFAEAWRFDIWIPLAPTASTLNRGFNYLLSLGRLRSGVSLPAARRQLDELATRLSREHPDDRYTFTARDLHDVLTDTASRGLWVLLGATVLLLLIACANVANLLLARAVGQQRALAVRTSLGATRGQLVSLVLGETMALALAGSVAGTAMAWTLLRAFVSMAPPNFPRLSAIALDWRVLALAALVALVAAAVAALTPAIHLFRSDPSTVLQAGGGRGTTVGRARAMGRLLVVVEMALALALVSIAGLMVKSLLRLQATDLGITREPLLTFSVSVPPAVADGGEPVARFQTEFLRRVRTVPGVTQASAINMLPVAATGSNGPVRRPDQLGERDGVPVTEVRVVMDGYPSAMGIRLLAGRAIDEQDTALSAPVAVVNEALASRLWPSLSPLEVVGRLVRAPLDSDDKVRQVVGVMSNVRARRPELPPDPEIDAPFLQFPLATLTYVVRGEGDPTMLTGLIRAELDTMAPQVALAAVRTFENVVATATRTSVLLSSLSVLFGVLAGTLAAVGVFGLLSYAVAQRVRELAVRAAVGASRTALLLLILREGLVLSAFGILAGMGMAWAASGAMASLLYEVSATDASVLGAAAAGLAVVAAAGAGVPAMRASRVEPVVALRGE
jgi:putative ABC transport system permease protein